MVPILRHPDSRYRAAVGVELGVEKILFINDLSRDSNSSRSVLEILYHTSELVKRELRNIVSLNRKAILK